MKTLQIIVLAGALISTAFSGKAQLLNASLSETEAKFDVNAAPVAAAKYSRASVMITKAGVKAVKNFDSRFKNASDVKWALEKEVISAAYSANGINSHVVFDIKGNWMRNMNVYYEDKMDKDLNELVKRSIYFNHTIKLIQEFQENNILFYVVHLEDAKTCKQIVVCDGEIGLYSQFKKQ